MVGGWGREGSFYSDNPNGDTLWFKANVLLKAIQISEKLFQVKTEKKRYKEKSIEMRPEFKSQLLLAV